MMDLITYINRLINVLTKVKILAQSLTNESIYYFEKAYRQSIKWYNVNKWVTYINNYYPKTSKM